MAAHRKVSTRIVCISDTHSNYGFTLPDGDILIHAGDLTQTGKRDECEYVLNWFKSLKQFRLKILIAGNHDVTLDKTYYDTNWKWIHMEPENTIEIINMFNDSTLQNDYGIIYLQDQIFIDPVTQLKFYGSPWQPAFCNWAFNIKRDSEEIRSVWNKIPLDTDILITHGPPYSILDSTKGKEHAGCKALFERVQIIKPKLHVFGHIHEGYGKQQDDDEQTIFVNASTCDLAYRPVQPPIVVEL
ncbi:unnamed protein product [Adineta steineri]|uniref:Calcineurin-like phosphoesterase domain-containing protein n=1 Tax=Adineta steineri TaxID=433720 RepID=A0A814I1K4_9BILA|nr:unnamed protein product [Adineta steineri]CAF1018378.1 unnamed protein product [Adineta steineri]